MFLDTDKMLYEVPPVAAPLTRPAYRGDKIAKYFSWRRRGCCALKLNNFLVLALLALFIARQQHGMPLR